MASHYDLIVIGSGMGGLTVASLMAQLAHKRVLVLERHFKLGGFTHSFVRPGNRSWDVGLHYVGEMASGELAREICDLITQNRVEWHKMPSPFEKFVYPNFTFEVPDNENDYLEALINHFPDEETAIRRYFADIHAVRRWFNTYVFAQSAPAFSASLLRFFSRGKEQLALCTTGEYLSKHFRNPRLKAVLASQWGDYGLPPSESAFLIHAVIVSHYLKGGYYPAGGAGTIAESVASVIEAYGGRCLLNHIVTEILTREGKAVGVKATAKKGAQNREVAFYAPVIVSDAGAYTTFCRLLPGEASVPFRSELERMVNRGYSAVSVYLGFKANPSILGFSGANHWIFADDDHDAIFKNQNGMLEGRALCCFLSFPSLRDPKRDPKRDPNARSHTAEIVAPLPYETVEAWRSYPWRRRGRDYEALKHRIAEALLNLVDTYYPGFKALVDFCEVATPLTVETFTGHPLGSIYGLPAVPERYRLSRLRVATPVENLYLTGADVVSPGIVGAMMGGVATAAHLLGRLGFWRIISAAKKHG